MDLFLMVTSIAWLWSYGAMFLHYSAMVDYMVRITDKRQFVTDPSCIHVALILQIYDIPKFVEEWELWTRSQTVHLE